MADSINNPRIFQTYTVGIKNEGVGYDPSTQWKGSEEQTTYDFILGLNSQGVKNAYSGFLEVYDKLVKQWFSGFEILDATNKDVIKVTNITFGVPERTFASNLREGKGSLVGRINLPAISFNRTDTTRVNNRGPVLAISHRQRVYFDDVTKKFVESQGVHKMLDLKYTVNFWTKYQQELQMLMEQFMLPFQPDFYFLVKVPECNNFEEVIRCHWDNSISQTPLVAAADTERIVKATANFTLEAYVPTLPSRIEKTISSINLQKAEITDDSGTSPVLVTDTETDVITKLYTHEQDTEATEWTVAYGYSQYNRLIVFNGEGDLLQETVDYTVTNHITYFTLTFLAATSGKVDIMQIV